MDAVADRKTVATNAAQLFAATSGKAAPTRALHITMGTTNRATCSAFTLSETGVKSPRQSDQLLHLLQKQAELPRTDFSFFASQAGAIIGNSKCPTVSYTACGCDRLFGGIVLPQRAVAAFDSCFVVAAGRLNVRPARLKFVPRCTA